MNNANKLVVQGYFVLQAEVGGKIKAEKGRLNKSAGVCDRLRIVGSKKEDRQREENGNNAGQDSVWFPGIGIGKNQRTDNRHNEKDDIQRSLEGVREKG